MTEYKRQKDGFIVKKEFNNNGCGEWTEKLIKGIHVAFRCGDNIARKVQLCPKCKEKRAGILK